jgi:tetratricopeptide (TPR) repeat protein
VLGDIAPYVALAALAAALVLGGAAFWLARRQNALDAQQKAVLGQRRASDLVEYVLELEEQVGNLREAVTILTEEVEHYRHDLDASLSNIALVRFDAFPDTGGEQSASIALLDNYRSGIVISIIASRETARLYVKFLDHGLPDRRLAPEETSAVERAVPRPLPRGELSRSPVSTFSRDVRRTIEEVRRTAGDAGAPATDPLDVDGTEGEAFGAAPDGETAVPAYSRAAFSDWWSAGPETDAQPPAAAPGDPVADEPGGARDSALSVADERSGAPDLRQSGAAAERLPDAADLRQPGAVDEAAPATAPADEASHAAPVTAAEMDPASGGRSAAMRDDDRRAAGDADTQAGGPAGRSPDDADAQTPGPAPASTAAEERSEPGSASGTGTDGGDADHRPDDDRPDAETRAPRRHDDWLGGEELDF